MSGHRNWRLLMGYGDYGSIGLARETRALPDGVVSTQAWTGMRWIA